MRRWWLPRLGGERWPGVEVFGVDLSETAIETTKKRLAPATDSASIAVTANGYDVATWSRAAPESFRMSDRLAISMWFVGHQFSEESPQKMTTFLMWVDGDSMTELESFTALIVVDRAAEPVTVLSL